MHHIIYEDAFHCAYTIFMIKRLEFKKLITWQGRDIKVALEDISQRMYVLLHFTHVAYRSLHFI